MRHNKQRHIMPALFYVACLAVLILATNREHGKLAIINRQRATIERQRAIIDEQRATITTLTAEAYDTTKGVYCYDF